MQTFRKHFNFLIKKEMVVFRCLKLVTFCELWGRTPQNLMLRSWPTITDQVFDWNRFIKFQSTHVFFLILKRLVSTLRCFYQSSKPFPKTVQPIQLKTSLKAWGILTKMAMVIFHLQSSDISSQHWVLPNDLHFGCVNHKQAKCFYIRWEIGWWRSWWTFEWPWRLSGQRKLRRICSCRYERLVRGLYDLFYTFILPQFLI